jgi:hypothetical protein
MSGKKRLGEMLRERALVDDRALKAALEVQRSTGDRLGSTLLKLELVDPEMLASLLGEQQEVEGIDPARVRPTPEACQLLTFEEAMTLGALPLWLEHGTLGVALTDPSDEGIVGKLEDLTGKAVRRFVAPQMALYKALKRAYRGGHEAGLADDRLRKMAASLREIAGELEDYLLERDMQGE